MSRLKSLPALETQSMPQPIRSFEGEQPPERRARGEQQGGVLGLQMGDLGIERVAIEEQTGQPADQSGPNMKW